MPDLPTPRRGDQRMSRRTVRPCVALAVMAAGGLAGPAAGQSSAWYNPTPESAATIRQFGANSEWLGVECVHGALLVVWALAGSLADSIFELDGPAWSMDHRAFRFDGRPESEIVLPVVRTVARNGVRLEVSDAAALHDGPDALIPWLRSASYAETARPGTGRWRTWSLGRATDAIDRLPCYGGGA